MTNDEIEKKAIELIAERVKIINVEPDDILVIESPHVLSDNEVLRIYNALERMKVKSLVLDTLHLRAILREKKGSVTSEGEGGVNP